MNYQQCSMARASLGWSRDDLARHSGVALVTIARFEQGRSIADLSRTKIRAAFEAKRVKFVDDGPLKGAVQGPTQPAR